jgi:hypothetical protein
MKNVYVIFYLYIFIDISLSFFGLYYNLMDDINGQVA